MTHYRAFSKRKYKGIAVDYLFCQGTAHIRHGTAANRRHCGWRGTKKHKSSGCRCVDDSVRELQLVACLNQAAVTDCQAGRIVYLNVPESVCTAEITGGATQGLGGRP